LSQRALKNGLNLQKISQSKIVDVDGPRVLCPIVCGLCRWWLYSHPILTGIKHGFILCSSLLACTLQACLFAGTHIFIQNQKPWSVLLVSEVMARAHSLSIADELIFIDSSSSCDATHSTITAVLVASKSGAIPLAVLIHEGQSGESYEVAFRLLQAHYPRCFNGRSVSK